MPYFFAKLIPPRASFVSDMNDAERSVMLAHQDYWLPQVNAGVVVAMGSVLDPRGGYGALIVNADSTEMLEGWQAKDPAILSSLGFIYENASMPHIRIAPTEPLAPVHSISP